MYIYIYIILYNNSIAYYYTIAGRASGTREAAYQRAAALAGRGGLRIHVCVYIYIYIYTCVYVYIYIYREREGYRCI